MLSATYDFFGIVTEIFAETREDFDHFRFYYQGHTCGGQGADVRVRAATATATGFVAALGDASVEKTLSVAYPQGDWAVYDRWTKRSHLPSPLPPVSLPPFRHRFTLQHASCLAPTDADIGIVIAGPSLAGKTSLLLELLSRGWRFVSDDLVVMDSTRRALPYTRPLTVRSGTLKSLTEDYRAAVVAQGRRLMTTVGEAYLVSPCALPCDLSCGPVEVVRRFMLTSVGSSAAALRAPTDVLLPGSTAERADCIEAHMIEEGVIP